MNYVCITYKELAEMLSVSHATVKANWKYYPHFFITELSKSSNNLKGARFNLEDVLNFVKNKAPYLVILQRHKCHNPK